MELKGPRSPLEMTLYSLTRKSQGLAVQVEWNSVNSVLLDTYPMDPHDRFNYFLQFKNATTMKKIYKSNRKLLELEESL